MAKESTIQHYNSSTPSGVPLAADLVSGEIAINTSDEKLFFKNAGGTVLSLSETKDLSGNFARGNDVINRINVGLLGASFTGTVGISAGAAIKITTTTNPQRITIAGSYTLKGGVGTLPFTDSSGDDFQADSNLKFDYLGDLSFSTPAAVKIGRTTSSLGYIEFGDGTTQSTAFRASQSVNSVNGCTGAITITGTVNEIEVTQVCPQVVIGMPDNVSVVNLTVTGATFINRATFSGGLTTSNLFVTNGATFNSRATFSSGLTTANLYVSGGATFGGTKIDLIGASFTMAASNSTGSLTIKSSKTGSLVPSDSVLVMQGEDADVGGIARFYGSAASVEFFSDSFTVTGQAYFNNKTHHRGGMTSSELFVVSGATFNSRATFSSGLTTSNLFVTNGATFGSRASFSAGLTTDNLFVTNGATFSSRATFSAGLTTANLYVSAGSTFGGNISAPNIVNSVNGLTGAVTVSTGISWSVATADQGITANTGVFANKGTLLTLTLPVSSSIGDTIKVSGMTAGLWKIAQNASQVIHFGKSDTTVGTGGYLASTLARDSVEMVCCVTNNEWNVVGAVGNITIV